MARKINNAGMEMIKSFEDFSATTYLCPGGKPTIGWGHAILPGEHFTEPISPAQGLSLLARDVATAEAAVERLVKVALTDNHFAALVSFTYNLGPGRLACSTLLRLLNAGDYAGAADEIPKWRYGGGRVLAGLERRRAAERAMFVRGDATSQTIEQGS